MRRLRLAALSLALAACDDDGVAPAADARASALLLTGNGRAFVASGDATSPPRELARLGRFAYGCRAAVGDGRVLVTMQDTTDALPRFEIVVAATGSRERAIRVGDVQAASGGRLDLGFPTSCTLDPATRRLALPARLDGRAGIALVSLDSARLAGFVRTDDLATGTLFAPWRGRDALLVVRYPVPRGPLVRAVLHAHDAATLELTDSLTIPASEGAGLVRLFAAEGGGVSVQLEDRISWCRPAPIGCTRATGSALTTPATLVPGRSALLGVRRNLLVNAGTGLGEVVVLTVAGVAFEAHAFGGVMPVGVTVDRATGRWLVVATRVGVPIPGEVHIGPRLPTVVDDAALPPDVLIVYDPTTRRELRRFPLPVGTWAPLAVD